MAGTNDESWSEQLRETGFFVVPHAVDLSLLTRLRQQFGDLDAARLAPELFADTGAFLPLDLADELTVEALTWPRIWQTLAALSWDNPKLHSFYVSAKPPGAEALPWHCDVYYQAPDPVPTELFLILYLHDTTPANGCLRVVPGSHRSADSVDAARHTNGPASAAIRRGEVDVPVRAGDLFVADRRLLHATHANRTAHWRYALTIAVAPAFDTLPETVRARIVSNPCLPRPGWWESENVHPRLHPLLPRYDGDAAPIPIG